MKDTRDTQAPGRPGDTNSDSVKLSYLTVPGDLHSLIGRPSIEADQVLTGAHRMNGGGDAP